jgi:hypothetical protein
MMDNFWPNFMPSYGCNPAPRGVLPAFGNSAGKYFLYQSSWPYNTGNKIVTYHLFHHHSDAFLTVYTEVPQTLSVSHANVINEGDITFDVTATAGSLIALSFNGQVLGVDTGTGAPKSVHITPGILSDPDSMTVVVTKQNYFRYQSKVRISPMVGINPITGIPKVYSLSQNFPNPFNPETEIQFGLPAAANVKLVLYDVLGREVAVMINSVMGAGYHGYKFNAENLSSGVYFYRLTAGTFTDIKKMTIIK